jgi:hypothetical protein
MDGDGSLSGAAAAAAAAAVDWPIDVPDGEQDADDALFFSPDDHDSSSSSSGSAGGDPGAWLFDVLSRSEPLDGAAAAAPAVTSQVQLPAVRAKKRRRNFGGATLSAEEVEAFMQEGLEARPLVLNLASTPQVACGGWVFKEAGKNIRPADPRADKWRRGGGAGAATDLPNSLEPRVRRRYGYVVPAEGSPRLRYHQYCRLIPAEREPGVAQRGGDSANVVEDSQTWLYHVLSEPPPVVPLAPTPTTSVDDHSSRITKVLGTLHVQAESKPVAADMHDPVLRLSAPTRDAGQIIDFVHFEAAGRNLGGIYHGDHGLQLRSAAGDFAEWHPAKNRDELPYPEGSVVGLFSGKISLRTADADMVAVVSRRAMCVGSFPGPDKAVDGDIIAYLGQVPVRVRGRVAAGDLLVPSLRHDGTAVAWQHETKDGKRGDAQMLVVGVAMSGHLPGDNRGDANSADIGTVDALITPPSAQGQGRQHQQRQVVNPVLEFMTYQHRSSKRRHGIVLRSCIAGLIATIGLVLTIMYVRPPYSSHCDGTDCGGGSVRPPSPAVDEDPCNAVSCEPGNCSAVGNGSRAASLSFYRAAESSVQTAALHGAAEARCNCPEGFSSKVAVGVNGSALPSCERNVCTTVRSSLVDPAASHTLQWASGHKDVPCMNVRSFELCQYVCDPGYLPMGDASCLSNGTIVGGACMPARCKTLAIPHSDRSHGNECTGATGDGCNFTCANGYRRAQAHTTSGVAPAEGTGMLQCVAPAQEFLSEFAFAVSGANDSVYNGVYTMTDRTCHGRAVWQQQHMKGGAAVVDGPVLYAREVKDQGGTVAAPHNTYILIYRYATYFCSLSTHT